MISSVLRLFRGKPGSRTRLAPQRRARLGLEALEDRQLLAASLVGTAVGRGATFALYSDGVLRQGTTAQSPVVQTGVKSLHQMVQRNGVQQAYFVRGSDMYEYNGVPQWVWVARADQVAQDARGDLFVRSGDLLRQMSGIARSDTQAFVVGSQISGVQSLHQMLGTNGTRYAYYVKAGGMHQYDNATKWVYVTGADQVLQDQRSNLFVLTNNNLVQMSGVAIGSHAAFRGSPIPNVVRFTQSTTPAGMSVIDYLQGNKLYQWDGRNAPVLRASGVTAMVQGSNSLGQPLTYYVAGNSLFNVPGGYLYPDTSTTNSTGYLTGTVTAVASSTDASGRMVIDYLHHNGELSQWNGSASKVITTGGVAAIAQGSNAQGKPQTYYLGNNGYVYPDTSALGSAGFINGAVTALTASVDASNRPVIAYLKGNSLSTWNGASGKVIAASGVQSIAEGVNRAGYAQTYYLGQNGYVYPDTSALGSLGYLTGTVKSLTTSTDTIGRTVVTYLRQDGELSQWNGRNAVVIAASGVPGSAQGTTANGLPQTYFARAGKAYTDYTTVVNSWPEVTPSGFVTVGFQGRRQQLRGDILAKWLSEGGPAGYLGQPTGQAIQRGAFYAQPFTGGIVVAGTGAVVVVPGNAGDISNPRGYWESKGGLNGNLGGPTSEQTVNGDYYPQSFEGGVMVDTPWNNPVVVPGRAGDLSNPRGFWENQGGMSSSLGAPTSPQFVNGDNYPQSFERGILVDTPFGNPFVITDNRRVLYMNFDGASLSRPDLLAWESGQWLPQTLQVGGPESIDADNNGIVVSPFLAGLSNRETVIRRVMELLREDLVPFGINVVRLGANSQAVTNQGVTTLFVGPATLTTGKVHVACDIDVGNNNSTDIAFVGDERWTNPDGTFSVERTALAIGDVALHEAGHTYGLHHVASGTDNETMGLRYNTSSGSWIQNTTFRNQSYGPFVDNSGAHGSGQQNSFAVMNNLFAIGSPASPTRNPARMATTHTMSSNASDTRDSLPRPQSKEVHLNMAAVGKKPDLIQG